MQWINSAGGPLILMNERSLEHWGGVVDERASTGTTASWSPGNRPTDYDRACAIDTFLEQVFVGADQALVLGCEPMHATWLAGENQSGGVLIRCLFMDTETQLLHAIQFLERTSYKANGAFTVTDSVLVLFDAAIAGRNIEKFPAESLTITLAAGVYQLSTAVIDKPDHMFAVVHKVERAT